jgi:hypothetical protein
VKQTDLSVSLQAYKVADASEVFGHDARRPGGAISSRESALSRITVPASSWPIGRLYPATFAERMAPPRFVCAVGFIEFNGARDPAVAERLAAAFRRDRGVNVKSLRRAPAEPDETSWLAGEGWWLSTAGLED